MVKSLGSSPQLQNNNKESSVKGQAKASAWEQGGETQRSRMDRQLAPEVTPDVYARLSNSALMKSKQAFLGLASLPSLKSLCPACPSGSWPLSL